jgi:hypothetical protein
MTDVLDVSLNDEAQIDEIELLTDLMALAARTPERLDPHDVDAMLGVASELSEPYEREVPAQRLRG